MFMILIDRVRCGGGTGAGRTSAGWRWRGSGDRGESAVLLDVQIVR
jgi:hypothetical protein